MKNSFSARFNLVSFRDVTVSLAAGNSGGAPVFQRREEDDGDKGVFAKRKKARVLTINIEFPTILGLK